MTGIRFTKARRPGRALTLVAAAAAVTLAATGCDASPFAARVGSQVIKQTALEQQLRTLAGNRQYVSNFDQQNSQYGVTVAGSAPGSYSAEFAAGVLGTMVSAAAVHQDLSARHQAPSGAALAAARSYYELQLQAAWQAFPDSFRNTQVQELAERALIEPDPSPTARAQLQSTFQSQQAYFFAKVCTRQVTVSVTGTGGGVDLAASQAKADQIQSQYNLIHSISGPSAPDNIGGAVVCYTPAQLEDQPPGFFDQVLGLAPGQAAKPVRQGYGYTILAVDGRTLQTFTPAVARVLAYVSQQSPDTPALVRLLTHTPIKVNPAFGSWSTTDLTVVAPSTPATVAQHVGVTNLGGIAGVSSSASTPSASSPGS